MDKNENASYLPSWKERLPSLGVGLGFRRPLARQIVAHRADIDFLEIISEHYLDRSRFEKRELRELTRRFPLIPHGLSLSLGTGEPASEKYLRQVRELVERLDAPWWSDHLAITHAGGLDIGHLAPVPLTEAALDSVCENIGRAKARVSKPLILENIAYTLRLPGAEMTEAEFITRVIERTDCGLLLDLMNLHANSINHGYDAYGFLESIPLKRVVQVHIIGGHYDRGVLIDSHSTPAPDAVWRMLDFVAQRTAINAVLLEWDERFPDFEVILEQLARARDIVSRAAATLESAFANAGTR